MKAVEKAHWYLNRLKLMQPAEISHRLLSSGSAALERLGAGRVRIVPAPSLQRFGVPWCASDRWEFDADVYVSAAQRLLAGRWDVFSLRDAPLGFPPEWNRDPLTGTRAPRGFGKSIDYRDEARVGNIKYLWEPARHLELVTLAQAWKLTGEQPYLDGCATLLRTWFEQCPYPMGVHWSSSLESAVRLLNWSVSWHLLGGVSSPAFDGERGATLQRGWLKQIYLHQHFIAGHLSRHSSANNHLLGELMGLFVAGLTWPCWPESARWLAEGKRQFEQQALLQNWEDGVNKEQGIYYHHEVADMMLLCGLFGRANGLGFGSAYWQRLEAMLEFIDALMDAGGNVPMIGDADDALMVRFDPQPGFDPYRSLLCTGAELFDRPQWRRCDAPDVKTRWLLGPAASPATSKGAPSLRRDFAQGGYWVLGSDRGSRDEVHLVADAGPLGYLSIAAHGHADALSFVLSLGGQPILVDPGTYAYHTLKRWRDYFRGTAAHNTLRVDGLDQSVIGGNFMWLHKADARCLSLARSAAGDDWLGEHDGYRRLRDPLTHRRRIEHRRAEALVRVTDGVKCAAPHSLEWHWHFAPECKIDLKPAGAVIRAPGWLVTLRCDAPGMHLSVHTGQEDPPLGWVSRRFDHKEPSPTLRCAIVTDAPRDFVTELHYQRH